MLVKDAMKSPVVTVNQSATLSEVARILGEQGISGLPVVDDEGLLVGVVSELDLIKHSQKLQVKRGVDALGWVSPYTDPDEIAQFTRGLCTVGETKVSEVMTRKVLTVKPDGSLEDVARLMAKKRVNRLPVVDHGHVVGIITRRDMIWAMANLCDVKPGVFDE